MRELSPQQTVRQPSKSVRIRKEMAVSPQALRAQSVDGQNFVDSVNPATGQVEARIPATPLEHNSSNPRSSSRRAERMGSAATHRTLRNASQASRRNLRTPRRHRKHRHSRNRQAPRRSHPRRSASRSRHRRLPRAPGAAMAAPGTSPAPQHRAEGEIRLARVRATSAS